MFPLRDNCKNREMVSDGFEWLSHGINFNQYPIKWTWILVKSTYSSLNCYMNKNWWTKEKFKVDSYCVNFNYTGCPVFAMYKNIIRNTKWFLLVGNFGSKSLPFTLCNRILWSKRFTSQIRLGLVSKRVLNLIPSLAVVRRGAKFKS